MKLPEAAVTWIDTIPARRRQRAIVQSPAVHSRDGIAFMELPRSLIRYRVTGQGDHTLVLATDPPVMIEQYDDLIHQLEKYFRVVVFELPGFGYSLPGSGFEFNFNRVNDLVAAFLTRLRLGPYLLAFPCVSAYGAVDIATRHSDLVSGPERHPFEAGHRPNRVTVH